MVCRLADLGYEALDLGDFAAVCWDGIGFCIRGLVWEGIEGCAGFVAGGGFAGGDVDFGAAYGNEMLASLMD